jgi:hypothetical protein
VRRVSLVLTTTVVALGSAATGPAVAGASTGVYCVNGDASGTVRRVKPRSCAFVGPNATTPYIQADFVYITKLRWRGWGRSSTTAKGVYSQRTYSRQRVTVRLSGLDSCQAGGPKFYSKARITYSGAGGRSYSFRLARCDG